MSEELKDLQKFRNEWKKEIDVSRKETNGNGNSKDTHNIVLSQEKEIEYSSKLEDDALVIYKKKDLKRTQNEFGRVRTLSVNLYGKNIPDSDEDSKKISVDCQAKEIVLLNLPNPEAKEKHRNNSDSKKQRTDKDADENLLELLIADIDEITVIPFFDLQLPREIGLNIFRYLTIRDLCRCASVSKSWRNLAIDELLWFSFGVNLGFVDGKTAISDHTDWKDFVYESVIKQRELKGRWKERICRIDVLEYERGGSLCAVSLCDGMLCAGYSSNAVLLWDMRDNQRSTFKILDRFSDGQQQQHSYPTSTAVTDTICAAGFSDGNLNLWHNTLSTAALFHCHVEGPVRTIALATKDKPTCITASDHEIRIDIADVNGQWNCCEQKTFETQIQAIECLPRTRNSIVIATRDTLHFKNTTQRDDLSTIDHVIGGKITCLDCNPDVIAIGVGPYGFGVLGNTIRLYRSDTGSLLSVLSGHYHEVTCLNLKDSPPQRIVTGSYDRRVRIFDLRTEAIALTLRGLQDHVTTVQMDDWKVISGAHNGNICVWDQRTSAVLWHTHARHPVRFCHFNEMNMVSANIPNDKAPQANSWYADDLIVHRRSRGSLRLFDFSSDNATQGVPEICSSRYDDTTGYNYNIALVTPYDDIN